MVEDVRRYGSKFQEAKFWAKVKRFARKAGCEVLEKAFLLYHVLHDPEVPAWAKGVVLGALGYFVFPIDAIPDLVPVFGFSDDLAVMAGALVTVAAHVTPETRAKAAASAAAWLP